MALPARPGLEHVAAYRPGRPPRPVVGQASHKLSSNENPYDPLPSVKAAVAAQLDTINRYPEMAAMELRERLARRFDVDPNCLVFGAGSVEVAGQIIHAVTGPGDEVLFAWRSFEAYPILTRVAGATPVMVPLDGDGRHDLDAMADAITDRTRVVFVCNPNNPTGTVVTKDELDRFLARVPDDVVVVVDEAYVHFDVAPDSPDGLTLFRSHDNVVVLHTFSKAYGLAGLRLGYALAPLSLAETLRKVAVPFAVTSLAQRAAIASLDAEEELQQRIDELVAERSRVYSGLRRLGLPVLASQANFVWLATGERTEQLAAILEAHGLSVRAFPGEGIRISLGDPRANDALLAAAAELSVRQEA